MGDGNAVTTQALVEGRLDALYSGLRLAAHRQLRRYRPGATLNTTALVHEAWIRLSADDAHAALPRDEFLKLASTAMRQLIVDYARRRGAVKRGGGAVPLELDPDSHGDGLATSVVDVIAIDSAMRELGKLDPALETLAECRLFAGMTMQEAATVLQRPMRSLERDWSRARAYLMDALNPA
nr:ECF-type sigma factor [Haliea sp.]